MSKESKTHQRVQQGVHLNSIFFHILYFSFLILFNTEERNHESDYRSICSIFNAANHRQNVSCYSTRVWLYGYYYGTDDVTALSKPKKFVSAAELRVFGLQTTGLCGVTLFILIISIIYTLKKMSIFIGSKSDIHDIS